MESAESKKHSLNNQLRQMYKRVKKEQQVNLSDLGLGDNLLDSLLELVAMPILKPEVYQKLGTSPPRGILLHGPPGCGKTTLAKALAGELQVPLFHISGPSIVSGMSGESEKAIRDIFKQAKASAPCLVLLDEVDSITPKRDSVQREMERRIVAQLLTSLDELDYANNDFKAVIVIGATNRPDAIDPALRRAGRFDREIALGVPDEECRVKILQVLTSSMKLENEFNFFELAQLTPGYVGADLKSLACEAGMVALKRLFNEEGEIQHDVLPSLKPKSLVIKFLKTKSCDYELLVTQNDFKHALKLVQPSSMREGFATVPGVTWKEIGALKELKQELEMAICRPIKDQELFTKLGITSPCGILLHGPPGCGKTMLAKAVANDAHSNFISVKGPELLNKYVGESERAVRTLFARARASAPCIIFFDEIDALAPRRDESSDCSSRVVNTMLTELDGLENRVGVYVIAATNRPDIIDPALLRPGRFDKLLFVDLPDEKARLEILHTLSQKTPLFNVDLTYIAEKTIGFSGADLGALIREAALFALRDGKSKVDNINFLSALNCIKPSVKI